MSETIELNGRPYRRPKRPTVVICDDGCDPEYAARRSASLGVTAMKLVDDADSARQAAKVVAMRWLDYIVAALVMAVIVTGVFSGFGVSLLVASAGLVLYLLPGMVARQRHHHNTTAIAALNLLLGWTALGWIAALIWALTNPPRR